MDEPFGALDPITRAEVQKEYKNLQQRLRKTVVFVTHDVSEALLLGDRIGLMEEGRLCGVFSKEEFLKSQNATAQKYVAVFREAAQFGGLNPGEQQGKQISIPRQHERSG